MTTPEEQRLAALLHGEAEMLDARDSLSLIRTGVARRRTRRRVALSASALGTSVALVGALVLAGGSGTSSLQPGPLATQPSASASAAPTPTPAAPALPADPDGSTTSKPGTPFWPFTSDQQAAAWAADNGARSWADNPVEVAQHLVDDLLRLEDLVADRYGDGPEVTLRVGGAEGEEVAEVELAQLGTGAERPWVVLRVVSADDGRPLVITSPDPGRSVTSPLAVTGTVPGVDESVRVSLRTATGTLLDEVSAPAGSELPWSATLRWKDTWTTGVVYAATRSPRDGKVSRLAAVPVRRALRPAAALPAPGSAFVGTVGGVVKLLSATDGSVLRQLSYPPKGFIDGRPVLSERHVTWVRSSDACRGSIVRTDLESGDSTTLLDGRAADVAASPSGDWLAWVTSTGCAGDGERAEVVLRFPTGQELVVAARELDISGAGPELLDLRDDGTILLRVSGEDSSALFVVPPGRDIAVRLTSPAGCTAGSAAFDSKGVIAFELCSPQKQPPTRVLFDATTGGRVGASPLADSVFIVSAATTAPPAAGDTLVLVQLADPYLDIRRVEGAELVPVLSQPDCPQFQGPGPTCVVDVDW